jgi:hypothetical protein
VDVHELLVGTNCAKISKMCLLAVGDTLVFIDN